MLSPDSRQTLMDALRPPAGSKLGCAVGTTYSLSLDAALTAPAAFALYGAADLRESRSVEPLELLDSIRRHADRFTIFFQAGQVTVPTQRRLFAFLEGGVIPVQAPNGGVFHPKLWVLRFDSDEAGPSYRMLCASRNLTNDRSWDTMLRLDSIGPGSNTDPDAPEELSAFNPSGLAEMVRALPGMAVGHVDGARVADIVELASQLEGVRWSPPPGVRSGEFLPLGLSETTSLPFPESADRVAVVSPFLTAGLLNRLPTATGRRVLVSRPDQILAGAAAVKSKFVDVFTLDPDAMPSGLDNEVAADHDQPLPGMPVTGSTSEDPGVPFDGLHAKLFVFDQGASTVVLTGSANATSAAFGKNVEFLTRMVGPRKALGVEALFADPMPGVQTLRSFLIPYPVDELIDTDADGDPTDDQLDELRRLLASLPFEARAVEHGSDDRFTLRFSSSSPAPQLPIGATWRCWPVSVTSDASQPIDRDDDLDVSFGVSFEAITAFLANEITMGEVSTRFVIVADLREAPDNRSTRLLRLLLGDAQRFLRYLLMLLADDVVDQFGLGDLLDALDSGVDGRWQGAPDALPLLESFLRTLARDPSRLDHVHHLIADLNDDVDGESLLPPGLIEVWEPIWAVAQELRR